MYMKEREREKT